MKDHEQTDFDKARDAEEEKYGKAELGTSMRSSFKAGANWARDWLTKWPELDVALAMHKRIHTLQEENADLKNMVYGEMGSE
ncbi:MAG: hypothetical protein ACXABY_31135 [Candidatus Thorarchaeota archaeon]|jgi:hypothetical protein